MDRQRFGALAQLVTNGPSRRDVLCGLAGVGLGLRAARLPDLAAAKKKRKRKKKDKKAKPNAFGCLNVGSACNSEEQCCSGICEGKKGKRTCRAHDTGVCEQDAPGVCQGNPLLAVCGAQCLCFRSTADSNVCGAVFGSNLSQCANCQKDADCLAQGFPAGTACAPIVEGSCSDVCEGGMACIIPCGAELPNPAG